MTICVWSVTLLIITFQMTSAFSVQPEEDTSSFCDGCGIDDSFCACTLIIEHKLTMLYSSGQNDYELVKPDNGQLVFKNGTVLTEDEANSVITADGFKSRLLIAINGKFPGPRIMPYENQELIITFINNLHTDSVTVHFHGQHQQGTGWADGVAFVTQCPIQPGQTFVHKFTAKPAGTSFYHAHIADQRSIGLYGPLIVRKRPNVPAVEEDEIVIALQDWNHDLDSDTAFYRFLTGQFNLDTLEPIKGTSAIDGSGFGGFTFQSGLVNGRGRYYSSLTDHNSAPLQRFRVKPGLTYRFRVIGASTLYPMRIYIEGHPLQLLASDGYELEPVDVASIVVQPGERYDFRWQVPADSEGQFLFVAESLETDESLSLAGLGYHGAEAIIEVEDTTKAVDLNPTNTRIDCRFADSCGVFNCPFRYYPSSSNKFCLSFNNVLNNDERKEIETVLRKPDTNLFFNFGFKVNEDTKTFHPSINGKEFVNPTVSMLSQEGGRVSCERPECEQGVCSCTHSVDIPKDKLIQMVFHNVGSGGYHPAHLHGHTFYVMKVGYGHYDSESAEFLSQTKDIVCTDPGQICIEAEWADSSWDSGDIPGMNEDPPEKDTVIIPTGGYVVVRFISDNPGLWFLHCHIDLHSTSGMAMVINEEADEHPPAPQGFPTCGNFMDNGQPRSAVMNRSIKFRSTKAEDTVYEWLIVKSA